jgi:hypothetical protein
LYLTGLLACRGYSEGMGLVAPAESHPEAFHS